MMLKELKKKKDTRERMFMLLPSFDCVWMLVRLFGHDFCCFLGIFLRLPKMFGKNNVTLFLQKGSREILQSNGDQTFQIEI